MSRAFWPALALLAALLLPPVREWAEASMARHMLLQFPLLMLCGYLLAARLPAGMARRIERWNAYGITGLVLLAMAMAVLMIPRVLDLAIVDVRVEAAKVLLLVLAGVALRLSWQRAGLTVQGFFLGNVLPMTGAVGQLYQDSPLRLCNAYLLDDQWRVGQALVAVAVVAALGWLAQLFLGLMRRERSALPASDLYAGGERGLYAGGERGLYAGGERGL